MKTHVFLDMDSVIADLNTAMAIYTGVKPDDLTEDLFWKNLGRFAAEGRFQSLPKMEMADKLVNFLDTLPKNKFNLSILTSVGDFYRPKAEVVVQKKRWLDKNFPLLSEVPFTCTTSGAGKAAFAHPNAFLIDDHAKNIEKFIEAGGHGHIWEGTLKDLTEVKFQLHKRF